MIKCVIFDYGDTLADSKAANKKAFTNAPEQKVLERHGLEFSKKHVQDAFCEASKKGKALGEKALIKKLFFAKEFLKELGLRPTEKLAQECENAYFTEREKHRKLMPNALELLKFLKKKGMILCVITNTRTDSNKKNAKRLGIFKYFKHFIMSHKVGSVKSELKIFRHLLERLNKGRKNKIRSEECLMVGNHAGEDGAAKLVGMKTAIYTRHLHGKKFLKTLKPDYLVKGLEEIEKIIQES